MVRSQTYKTIITEHGNWSPLIVNEQSLLNELFLNILVEFSWILKHSSLKPTNIGKTHL